MASLIGFSTFLTATPVAYLQRPPLSGTEKALDAGMLAPVKKGKDKTKGNRLMVVDRW